MLCWEGGVIDLIIGLSPNTALQPVTFSLSGLPVITEPQQLLTDASHSTLFSLYLLLRTKPNNQVGRAATAAVGLLSVLATMECD